jgi:hypothetical protein
MDITFDLRGNLQPATKIELSLTAFQELFVNKFAATATRTLIFEKYLAYLSDFTKTVTPDFTQWINGSFVSNKENPNDIDFVTMIQADVYNKKTDVINNDFRLQGVKDKYGSLLDAYTVRLFDEGHRDYFISQSDCAYWYDWFSKTKNNRAKQSFKKGFIEIKFSKNDRLE